MAGVLSPSVALAAEGGTPGKQSASLVRPPAGRLAIVADGNSPDPDDIGATAVIFGLLDASGLTDRLVHLSHSCDLKPATRISATDELRRQSVLEEICEYGTREFGPFRNLRGTFNCRRNQQVAVNDLRDAINHSSASDPLWIIEAGEPDIIGFALQAADTRKRQYVHVVSHHPANDNAGDFFTWKQIQALGITEHQIGDQNVGLKSDIGSWDWAKEYSDERIRWMWRQLAYAEQDGVVKFQTGHFDCSDAGMVYWWITGAEKGGNKVAVPSDVAAMLLLGSKPQPPFRNSIVSTDFDFITDADKSVFDSLSYVGRGRREMPDKRTDDLFADGCYLFRASFRDEAQVEIWASRALASKEAAEKYATMLTKPLGKLPSVMRKRLSHVVIHQGDETAFAEADGHFFVLYSENMETRVRNHDLEETVFHESVHATLDADHAKNPAWRAAQEADGQFLTVYAAKNPTKEDLAESALFAFTRLEHPGRLPEQVEKLVEQRIPNRLAYFRAIFAAEVPGK
ncbi:MAG: hypothetical protein Aurels2KO_00210 [Aureliella sp.]